VDLKEIIELLMKALRPSPELESERKERRIEIEAVVRSSATYRARDPSTP
jgi:hypothetical protein